MKKLDLMIFDFDGTLVDTGTDLINSVNYTLRSLKLEEKSDQKIISFVGDGISKLIERSLGHDNPDYHEEAMRIFTEHYAKHLMDKTVLYPHVEDILSKFERKIKIILTNKRYAFAQAIAGGLGIEKYFEEIIGAGSTPYLKPDRRLIEYLLDKYKARKEQTIIIGDGKNDILAAKNSGILSLAYLNGLGDRNALLSLGADYYCEDIIEIGALFE